ncbi:AEC family transporter [Reinekea marina]|uniref:AEC family transporter n=1 Tax=Reinekea marina TaxID=1310421 RepID=A0ABV7WS51_9GAMM|nr:AEC family transporter [Reinekea marina]MBU2863615.1 AEC family transporter [Reinekea forsetii]MDN3650479.1 AEC family transporter [Reinekea marina]
MMFRIFEIVAPIFIAVLVGYLYSRARKPAMETVNAINLDVFVPLLIISVFAEQKINLPDYGSLILVAFLITMVPGVAAFGLSKLLHIDAKTFVPPMMFKNSGNVGIPLLLFTFGEEFLPAIIIIFIVENTLHFTTGIWIISAKDRSFAFLKQPMIIATAIGLGLSLFNVQLPFWVVESLRLLGNVAVPLLLFSLGVRLVSLDIRGWKLGMLGAVAAPVLGLLVAAPLATFIPLPETQQKMIWLFAALPPAVLNFLIAEKYNQEPDKVAAIVLFANAATVVTLPLVLYFVL